jgi:hypothetical protein
MNPSNFTSIIGAIVRTHAFRYEAGKNTLEMIGTGSYVILGVMPAKGETSGNAQ